MNKEIEGYLDQSKQSIEANNSEHPTGTLAMTFHRTVGETNMYVWFGYIPQTICNNTQGQVSGSMNADQINVNKHVKSQRRKDDN